MGGIFFRCDKTTAIHFEEQYAHDESSSFIPVDERVVANYSHHVGSGHVYGIGSITVHEELLRTSKRRPKKSQIPYARSTTIERQKPIMERKDVTFVNPDRFAHLESEWRVLR